MSRDVLSTSPVPATIGLGRDAMARGEMLLEITAAIANAVTSEEVFRAVVDDVALTLGASSAGLWIIDDSGRTARLARALGYTESTRRHLEEMPIDLEPGLPVLDAIRSAAPVWIPSRAAMLERYPHLEPLSTPHREYRVSCLPLVSNGRVLGTLGLTIEESLDASAEERDFLQLVALYASQAVERLRLLEAERRSRDEARAAARRLTLLNHASRAFSETDLDFEPRVRGIATELGLAIGGSVALTLLEPDRRLRMVAVHHPIAEAEDALRRTAATTPIQVGEGISGTVVATGKSIVIRGLSPEEIVARSAPAWREVLEQFPSYAVVCAPLRTRGRVIGTLSAHRVFRGQTFGDEDRALVEELAERAALEIENARLYRETAEARSRAEQLYRFAEAVVGADRAEVVFESALAAIEAALGANRSAILTWDEDRVLRFRAWRHLSADYRRAVEGHSPWAPDAVAPAPVLVADAQADEALAGYHALFRAEGIGALAFIPLVSRGRLLGKFMVYYEQPHAFAPQEIETAQAIANHLGSVMTRFAAIAQLEETIRSNELFAGALAHDLRNPLGAIMTAAQVALMQREGEERGARDGRPLSRILSSGGRMANMIEQLLDFTRARSGGGIEIDPRGANLADLSAQAIGELEIGHPDWKIESETLGDLAGTWDADRLLQVISNLVANAGQHGTAGGPIGVRLDGTRRDRVTIEVRNGGVIPAPLLAHLFDPFRGTRHRRDQSRGLGLGLFIVREIVRAHGGIVQASSTETDGTRFTIELPRESVRRKPPGDGHPGVPPLGLR